MRCCLVAVRQEPSLSKGGNGRTRQLLELTKNQNTSPEIPIWIGFSDTLPVRVASNALTTGVLFATRRPARAPVAGIQHTCPPGMSAWGASVFGAPIFTRTLIARFPHEHNCRHSRRDCRRHPPSPPRRQQRRPTAGTQAPIARDTGRKGTTLLALTGWCGKQGGGKENGHVPLIRSCSFRWTGEV